MRFSLFDYVLAVLSFAASGLCATLLIRNGESKRWPFLLALCFNELLLIPVLVVPALPYRFYFWIFWIDQPIANLLKIGLGWDVLRSLPASDFIPQRLRKTLFASAIAIGVLSVLMVSRSAVLSTAVRLNLFASRAFFFAWLAVLLICIIGIATAGFAFTLTGMRIATGTLVRLASAATYSLFLSTSPPYAVKQRWNICDSTIGVAVFFYWSFTISRARQAEADLKADVAHIHRSEAE